MRKKKNNAILAGVETKHSYARTHFNYFILLEWEKASLKKITSFKKTEALFTVVFFYISRIFFKGSSIVKESLTFLSLSFFAFHSWDKISKGLK